jgi:hypothetical protein
VEDQNWKRLLLLLPAHWQQQALDTGARQRLRGFRSRDALLPTLLLPIACGYSLRETVGPARGAGLAQISDVALLNRLRQAEDWFQSLCQILLAESGVSSCPETSGRRIRIVDGTIVREPGPTGSPWRLLYSREWPAVRCDFLDLTIATGVGTGEWLGRVPVGTGDLLLADAEYGSVAGIEYVTQQEAPVLIRVNPSHFPLINAAGERLSLLSFLLSFLEPVTMAGQVCDGELLLRGRGEHAIAGRLCALCARVRRPSSRHDNASNKRPVESRSTREPKRGAMPNMYWSSAVGPNRPAYQCWRGIASAGKWNWPANV